jgi:hypothetical protein
VQTKAKPRYHLSGRLWLHRQWTFQPCVCIEVLQWQFKMPLGIAWYKLQSFLKTQSAETIPAIWQFVESEISLAYCNACHIGIILCGNLLHSCSQGGMPTRSGRALVDACVFRPIAPLPTRAFCCFLTG